jgi:hypothetical protein
MKMSNAWLTALSNLTTGISAKQPSKAEQQIIAAFVDAPANATALQKKPQETDGAADATAGRPDTRRKPVLADHPCLHGLGLHITAGRVLIRSIG